MAGFNQFFDDNVRTESTRYGIALDHEFSSDLYSGIEYSARDLTRNALAGGGDNPKERELRTYVNWTPADTMSFGLEYRFDVFESEIANVSRPQTTTHLLPLSFRFFYPLGFFIRLGATYVDQEVTADDRAQRENFTLVDAEIGYRLPKRYGIFRVVAGNLFDDDFDFQGLEFRTNHPEEELSSLLPARTISAQITLNF